MEIKLISEKRTLLVKIKTDLDHHSAANIRKAVDSKIKSSNAVNVIFDFESVDFMDSSGIGMLMGRYKITNILGGKVVIFGVGKQVMRIIEMTSINKLIKICADFDEAIKSV